MLGFQRTTHPVCFSHVVRMRVRLVGYSLASVMVGLAAVTMSGQVNQSAAGTEIVSPSVLATSSTRRDESGRFVVDLLILWRGSPGWSYRRSNLGRGSGMSSSSSGANDAFTIDQGGLHLTASY